MVHTHYHPPPLMKGFLSGETRGYDETPQKRQDNKQTFPRKWCPFFSPLFAGMFYTLAKGRSPGTLRALRQPAPTWVRTWPPGTCSRCLHQERVEVNVAGRAEEQMREFWAADSAWDGTVYFSTNPRGYGAGPLAACS